MFNLSSVHILLLTRQKTKAMHGYRRGFLICLCHQAGAVKGEIGLKLLIDNIVPLLNILDVLLKFGKQKSKNHFREPFLGVSIRFIKHKR
jgi:hypothetical protein